MDLIKGQKRKVKLVMTSAGAGIGPPRLVTASRCEAGRQAMYYVYVLLNKDKNKTYTGITNNLKRRIDQHNKGYGKYSRLHGQWVLVYSETLTRRVDARKREKYLKSSAGRRWMKSNIF